MMTYWCIAQNGIGVHQLKAGSKRRRTQAELREQYDMEQLQEVERMEKDAQLGTQAEELEQLKQKLAKMEEEHAEERQMAAWCRENVEQT